jgi:hypothetical protein
MLCLAAASLCFAGTPTNDFTISMNGGYLAVSEGELYFRRSTEGAIWYVMGTQIKSAERNGGYLAYDPKGKTNLVGLESAPGKGTEWSIAVPGKGRTSEGKRSVIRAASGPKRGWYLTIDNGSLILAENPPQKLEVERFWKY